MKKIIFALFLFIAASTFACYQPLELGYKGSVRGFLSFDSQLQMYVIKPTGRAAMKEKNPIEVVYFETDDDLSNVLSKLIGRAIAVQGVVYLNNDNVYMSYESYKL